MAMGMKAAKVATWKEHSPALASRGGSPLIKNIRIKDQIVTATPPKLKEHVVTISGHENVPASNEKMLKFVVAHQPVSVATDAGGLPFRFYSKGIFSGICGKELNHGMTIVGYGEENGEKFWLVKNSWANDWGESGYVRMKRDTKDKDGTCGIAMEATFPIKH